jgi:hypothetical protein
MKTPPITAFQATTAVPTTAVPTIAVPGSGSKPSRRFLDVKNKEMVGPRRR